ncbi:ATP-binding protein [Moraxellaceae bacterium AER2_44_116]|nr:ATP-binding protein [Moraxellaceae bacterium]TQC97205.1 ATP-binding protein [Moraxellaceae bacterium AER2_44_116]
MDNNTLQGLMIAYNAAPSAELAKIITLAHFKQNNIEASLPYLSGLRLPLELEDTTLIANTLIEHAYYAQAEILLNKDDPKQAILLVESWLAQKLTYQARELYVKTTGIEPSLRRRHLDIALTESATNLGERPKLRVIEKPDMATVTDLSRYKSTTTTFSDVVGLSEIKQQIHKKIILPFQRPSLFQRFKKRVGGGILLYGPPGCGKTLLARATAGECKASFYNIEISDVLDMYIGESEQKLHTIFEKARSEKPSVLFFDELEALAGKREHTRNSSSSHIISQFLAELDGFSQNNEGVLVLASTNVPWSIDPAFLRPGRFDRMFFVPPPDREARQSILEHHMKDRPTGTGIDYAALAKNTVGYSGADLANLVDMAADEAIDESLSTGEQTNIEYKHFREAVASSRSTTTEWLSTARNYARYANDGGRYNDVLDFLKKHGQ